MRELLELRLGKLRLGKLRLSKLRLGKLRLSKLRLGKLLLSKLRLGKLRMSLECLVLLEGRSWSSVSVEGSCSDCCLASEGEMGASSNIWARSRSSQGHGGQGEEDDDLGGEGDDTDIAGTVYVVLYLHVVAML